MRLTAAINQEAGFFVARCLEIEVTSQGATFEEARANLIEALELFFEDDEGHEIFETPMIVSLDVAI